MSQRNGARLPERFRAGFESLDQELFPQTASGVLQMVLGMVPPPPGRILNAGAGRGGLSKILSDAGYDLLSLDMRPEQFRVDGLECLGADLVAPLEFEDGTFDSVIAVEVAEHLEDPWSFFREALRVVRVDGQVLFTSPNVTSLPSRLSYLRTGILHYFREESFRLAYHVTPIFPWAVERFCRTTHARLQETRYSCVRWPDAADGPRDPGGWKRWLLDRLPRNHLWGEIAAYRLIRDPAAVPTIDQGTYLD
jgi:SAM-dependent methyltransferase